MKATDVLNQRNPLSYCRLFSPFGWSILLHLLRSSPSIVEIPTSWTDVSTFVKKCVGWPQLMNCPVTLDLIKKTVVVFRKIRIGGKTMALSSRPEDGAGALLCH